jgi:2,5-diamino-6-(ribosylamino)-4(3H)-pyrimidinone 5'-phosphate reductase
VQRLFPQPTLAIADPTTIYDDLWRALPEPPAGRPFVLLNMVTSIDGKAIVNGSVAGLGSDVDHRLMRALRAAVDAVMVGAGTFRADRVDTKVGAEREPQRVARGLPAEPLGIVLSRSGDLPLDRRFFTGPGGNRLAIVGANITPARRAALAARAPLLVAPDEAPDPRWVMRQLRQEYGVRHLLVEGGPGLNGELFSADCVDELCWTLAPKLVGGGEDTTMVEGPALPDLRRCTLVSAYLHEDEWFFRYRVTR